MKIDEEKTRGGRVAALIVAAGRGERAGQSAEGPKQYRSVGGRAILAHTVKAFFEHPLIDTVAVVIHPDDTRLFEAAIGPRQLPQILKIHGGSTRQISTRLGLLALSAAGPDCVLIHDGVRPFVDADLIRRVIEAVAEGVGTLPALPVSETLKRGTAEGNVASTVDRSALFSAQTPQGFPFRAILDAHERAFQAGKCDFTDDAAIAEWAGLAVRLVEGLADNVKLTWAKDIALADERLSRANMNFPDIRVGNGYDVHAFEAGDHVTLCGIDIPHDHRLSGHSDADVGLHALTDALLATCGAGDIGTHFPPSDSRWKGAASRLFVEHAVAIVRGRGGRIANADVTLICESPKIGPHRERMVSTMADMLRIEPERISVKATTNEKLGFIGRREGIAAIATVSVVYPGGLPA
jgi:2-C-methyl-D-erythritol 4-phosphate cytidylyltransferase/2-C-methyl-D-erythritol 2,4-cyclodiphosphate synthase